MDLWFIELSLPELSLMPEPLLMPVQAATVALRTSATARISIRRIASLPSHRAPPMARSRVRRDRNRRAIASYDAARPRFFRAFTDL
jgi:hypothetical protein